MAIPIETRNEDSAMSALDLITKESIEGEEDICNNRWVVITDELPLES